jgi:guanylate kinase
VVVVVSGPSGVGKDAVVRRLLEQRPELSMVVTATDRAPRPGETDGVDYHFTTTKRFETMIANGELIEHAVVYGQHKGIPKSSVRDKLSSNDDVVLRLDVQGAATVRAMMPDAVLVFLCAESEAALARRLFKRGTETDAQFARRVETARDETKRVDEFDYVVVNGDGGLEQAAARLGAIIDAEKSRRGRKPVEV